MTSPPAGVGAVGPTGTPEEATPAPAGADGAGTGAGAGDATGSGALATPTAGVLDGTPQRPMGAFDAAAERLFDRARGRRPADAAALVMSNLSDYGFAWAVLAAAKARTAGPARRRALVALAVAGVSSATVNAGVKRLVGRQRPEAVAVGAAPLPVRRPTSSSFPSGHTLASFCTAVTLPDRPAGVTAALGFAVGVAASRVHLQAHHATDVVGGAAIGTAVGLVARRVVTRLCAR